MHAGALLEMMHGDKSRREAKRRQGAVENCTGGKAIGVFVGYDEGALLSVRAGVILSDYKCALWLLLRDIPLYNELARRLHLLFGCGPNNLAILALKLRSQVVVCLYTFALLCLWAGGSSRWVFSF